MSSNLFINYSLSLMNLCYKMIGVKATNFMINKSVGSLFTSGETIQTLVQDLETFEKNGVFGVANYVVEGLETMDELYIQKVYDHMLESIQKQTEGRDEGHFALKLTALISTDVMTKMSKAQLFLMNDILKFDKQESISIYDVSTSLRRNGIEFTQKELDQFYSSLKF